VQTLRFTLFRRAAALVRPAGTVHRLTGNAAKERLFARIEQALPCAA